MSCGAHRGLEVTVRGGERGTGTFLGSASTVWGLECLGGLSCGGAEPGDRGGEEAAGGSGVDEAVGDLLYFFFTKVDILILSLVVESFLGAWEILGVLGERGDVRDLKVLGLLSFLGVLCPGSPSTAAWPEENGSFPSLCRISWYSRSMGAPLLSDTPTCSCLR